MKNRESNLLNQLKLRKLVKKLRNEYEMLSENYLPQFEEVAEESGTHPYFTSHAHLRSSHRAISRKMIEDTIKYGAKVCKQGLCFHIMLSKMIPGWFTKKYADKIKNTVVVVKRPDIVLTVYKNDNAMRQIRKKPKRLKTSNFIRYDS